MNKLIVTAIAITAITAGCTGTRVKVDGSAWSVSRLSILQKVANQKIQIDGVGSMEGYTNDGGSDIMSAVIAAAMQVGAQRAAAATIPTTETITTTATP